MSHRGTMSILHHRLWLSKVTSFLADGLVHSYVNDKNNSIPDITDF